MHLALRHKICSLKESTLKLLQQMHMRGDRVQAKRMCMSSVVSGRRRCGLNWILIHVCIEQHVMNEDDWACTWVRDGDPGRSEWNSCALVIVLTSPKLEYLGRFIFFKYMHFYVPQVDFHPFLLYVSNVFLCLVAIYCFTCHRPVSLGAKHQMYVL